MVAMEQTNLCLQIKSMPNFRNLCSKYDKDTGKIMGTLYRSSKPDFLEQDDCEIFSKLGIRTVVDCRSKFECLKLFGRYPLSRYFKLRSANVPTRKKYISNEDVQTVPIEGIEAIKMDKNLSTDDKYPNEVGVEITPGNHIFIDFFAFNLIWHTIIKSALHIRLYLLLALLFDFLLGNNYRNFAFGLMRHVVAKCGMRQQYKDIVEHSQNSICAVLKLLSKPENIPAIVNCAYGKDRTGIMSALILTMLGKSREYVIHDYTLSEAGLAPITNRVLHDILAFGLSEDFTTAKAEVMEDLLNYVCEKYGCVENYMEFIGFSRSEQEDLRRNLLGDGMDEE